MLESLVDACRDKVQPIIGSVLYCDLAFGYMEHSGIFIGNNQIIHLSGSGNIEVVSPKKFISGGTACSTYVSCNGTEAVGSKIVAERASRMIGTTRNYNFILDNCHQFSSGCISGDFNNSHNFLFMLKNESNNELNSNSWRHWDINLLD